MRDTPVSISISGGYQAVDAFVFARFLSLSDGWCEARYDRVDSAMDWHCMLTALTAVKQFTLNTNVDEVAALFEVETGNGKAAVKIESWGDEFGLLASGQTREAASAALDAVKALIPERAYDTAETVAVNFWSFDPMQGGTRYVRDMDRLPWENVARNYPTVVRSQLEPIVSLTDGPVNGRLFVFHGPAGSGKSRLMQTLGSEWSAWCRIDYIVDADAFFANASYMTKVMLGGRGEDRWRLVVVEDCDEFIDTHAKAKTGQGSARLLNICDGLVGQGLKVMVLASTNVHAARFSKAVVRPGRCAAQVEFPAFPAVEANEWAAAEGLDATFDKPTTLAQLYALKAGVKLTEDEE